MLVPIGISVLFVILFILGYRYLRGFYPGSTVIEEPEGAVDPSVPRLKFFYTTWCPHSRKALGEWKSLKQLIRNEKLKFGGKTIQFEALDGDSETTKVARYGVDAYPTIILETSTEVRHYEGRVKAARLRQWLSDVLGPEST